MSRFIAPRLASMKMEEALARWRASGFSETQQVQVINRLIRPGMSKEVLDADTIDANL